MVETLWTKCKQDYCKVLTYSWLAGTKKHGYSVNWSTSTDFFCFSIRAFSFLFGPSIAFLFLLFLSLFLSLSFFKSVILPISFSLNDFFSFSPLVFLSLFIWLSLNDFSFLFLSLWFFLSFSLSLPFYSTIIIVSFSPSVFLSLWPLPFACDVWHVRSSKWVTFLLKSASIKFSFERNYIIFCKNEIQEKNTQHVSALKRLRSSNCNILFLQSAFLCFYLFAENVPTKRITETLFAKTFSALKIRNESSKEEI